MLDLSRGGLEQTIEVTKRAGEPLGVDVQSALFDQVRTCDNHCEFCFIYQLPPGLRKSLYLKDDDYRLSFLYGNFTTLTRFTEADLERVVTERLSPLNVSIHATDPDVRTEMLRNRRGATSLRWLRALLDHGIEVHGQVVVCPGMNDGVGARRHARRRARPLPRAGLAVRGPARGEPVQHRGADARPHRRPRRARWSTAWRTGRTCTCGSSGAGSCSSATSTTCSPSARSRPRTPTRGSRCTRTASAWPARSSRSCSVRRRRRPAPRTGSSPGSTPSGSADADYEPYRGTRATADQLLHVRPSRRAPVGILSGTYGARVLAPLVARLDRDRRAGRYRSRTSSSAAPPGSRACWWGRTSPAPSPREPEGHRYLLPDVCLSNGRFLDGTGPEDLPRPVEVIATDGHALREALGLDLRTLASAR